MVTLPLAALWITAAALLFLDGRRRWVGWLAVLGLAAATAALVGLVAAVFTGGPVTLVTGGWPAGVGIRLRADGLGSLFAAFTLALLLAALAHEVVRGVRERAMPALVLFLGVGLTGLFLTGDVFNFYVFFEITMISAFVLSTYGQEARQVRNAVMFTVVNLLGTVAFLTAVAGLYHVTGTLVMGELAQRSWGEHAESLFLLGILIFVAFGIKLGLFPFHAWLPPVYRETRPVVAAVLGGVVANVGSYGLIRFGGELLPFARESGGSALLWLGSISILYGGVLASSRNTTREVLAYSSVSQAGYIMIGLGIGGPVGLAAAALYALLNGLNKTLLFLCDGLPGRWAAAAFLVGSLSVAGLPPVAGFFGKAALLQTGVTGASAAAVAVVVVGAGLSMLYMFRAFQKDYWIKGEAEAPAARAPQPGGLGGAPPNSSFVVLVLAGLIVLLGLWPEPLLALSRQAVHTLPGGTP
jgi:multicomponent Na+:H+ antiporter subunit D